MACRPFLVPGDDDGGGRWYFSRKEIEENSPSRRDGIDLKKENYFCKSYCSFIQDLGMKIKVPQVTIATATIFCHRFFLRQSHAKHDRLKIATACLFLASKVEESPRPLRNVILVSHEIIHRKDSEMVLKMFKKEGVYEEQKKLILQVEKLVLETLDFDLNVIHPYKSLVEAIKKFKNVADQRTLAQVAWNFINDGLRTSLCLQVKPRQVTAAALYLAAKFLKIKLHSEGQKAWWHEFAVTPSKLEEISNQMLELYDQDSAPRASQAKAPSKVLATGEHATSGTVDQANSRNHLASVRVFKNQNLQDSDSDQKNKISCEINQNQLSTKQGHLSPDHNTSTIDFEPKGQQEEENIGGRIETLEQKNVEVSEPPPPAALKKMLENKVKAALEKRRKLGADSSQKRACVDEDELIEMQLENGIELP